MKNLLATTRTAVAVQVICVLAATAGLRLTGLDAEQAHSSPPSHVRGDTDQQAVRQLFERYCFECHATDMPEANIRLDKLVLTLDHPPDHKIWQAVLEAVSNGQMPPDEADSPSEDERKFLASWIRGQLTDRAEKARQAGQRTRNRRLTVEEYNFTMQSLFGVDAQFGANLPPDPVSQEGFQNDGQLLGLSPLQMECYLDNARQAVRRYVQIGQGQEKPLRYFIELEDLYFSTADRYGTRKRAPRPVDGKMFQARRSANRQASPQYVGPLSPLPPGPFPTEEELRLALPKLHQQFLALSECTTTGEMIVRVRAAATPDRKGRYPRMRLEAGITLGDSDAICMHLLGEADVTAPRDKPAIYEFRTRVEDVPTKGPLKDEDAYDPLSVFDMVQIFISNVSRDERAIYALGPGTYRDPDSPPPQVKAYYEKLTAAKVNFLYLDAIEIEMLPTAGIAESSHWTVDLAPAHPEGRTEAEVAREFLERFMRRAYRRPVSATELATKMELFAALRQRDFSFAESLQETLAAILVSPAFLFLEPGSPGDVARESSEPTPHQLASRLSYFLWLTAPDNQLMARADDGSLVEPEVWADEAQRLLDDPRSRRLLDSFCRQWLRLDKFPLVAVNPEHYPAYDDDLARTTVQETLDYFAEVFRSDASALELLDSDYAMLNDRLADHYGIELTVGGDLQKVQLPPGSVRGGLLTQASLLTMNSDGVDSHPIRRGVWLLDRLLNSPPPPPPPNVPELNETDPDFRGLSLKERIELHRRPGACQSCHQKIDPWGIALENFDAVGRWREQVRIHGKEKDRAQPVDAAVQLPDGPSITGANELKRYLFQQRGEQFTRALAHHMLTYALGRPLDIADQPYLDAIYQRFAASDYRLRELVLAIVENEVFRQ